MSLSKKTYLGYIKRHPDGYGFFIPKDEDIVDVFISPEDMAGAMSNDTVAIKIFGKTSAKKLKGRIEKIVERHFTRVVGRLDVNGTHYVLKDKSYAWGEDLFIPSSEVNTAKGGELVLAEITSYPNENQGFCGRVISSIGMPSDPAVDVKRVIAESGAPMDFDPRSISEVQEYGLEIPKEEIQRRKDLRDLPLVTIDGVTAKDFDDAVYVERKGKNYRLVVAIADVSYYVRPGMKVDEDAYERGTSIYMPNYVVPMLPEGLSNELCSLKPNVERLAMVADMVIGPKGEFLNYDFYEAVIKSHGRLTYGQVQQILDGTYIQEIENHRGHLILAQELSLLLMEKRFNEGSLDLDIPEVVVEVDEQGHAVDIQLSERIFAHRLIEEFMLKANIAVAKFIDAKKCAQVFRVHEEPDMLSLDLFMRFYEQIIKSPTSLNARDICASLSNLEGKEKNILQSLFLRSMKQAKYSAENIGHFGLGFTHYSHFTSPIRRYPDLLIHRVLKSIVVKDVNYPKYGVDDLQEKATVLSQYEQRAVKAERRVKSIKKARFAEGLLSEDFAGAITSVVRFGLFVTLDQYPLEGLLRISDLGGDHFIFDEENLLLKGKKSGKVFKLGDRVKVQVAQVDIHEGFIDLELLEHKGKKQNTTSSSWSHKGRGGARTSWRKPPKRPRFGAEKIKTDEDYQKEKSGDSGSEKKSGKVKASDLFSSSHRGRKIGFGKNKSGNGSRKNKNKKKKD